MVSTGEEKSVNSCRIAHVPDPLGPMKRRIVHDQDRVRLGKSSTVMKGLFNEGLKHSGVRGALEDTAQEDAILRVRR